MPTYVYEREDGSTFELMQKITEDALEACPTTGQKVKRVITATGGLIFKGSGFYKTDYPSSGSSANGSSDGSGSSDSSSSGDSSSDSSSSAATCDGTGPKGGCGACSD